MGAPAPVLQACTPGTHTPRHAPRPGAPPGLVLAGTCALTVAGMPLLWEALLTQEARLGSLLLADPD